MRIFKSHPLASLLNGYLIDSPQPSNISYLWNFGSLLGFCLIIQIVTGVTLAMHYNPSVLEAFNSVEHVMRDVNNGWLIRYLHANTASAFFFIVYLHIGRGMYYGSYKAPRTLVWTIGTVIFILMIVTGFLGYVLPYGQMSLWGATVITNLMSAIPWIGQDIVEFIWGGFSVNNATLNRFFALHFVLPFVLAALALMHLIALHDTAGSGNPLGASGNYDRIPFAPYFIFKDLITIFLFIIVLSMYVFFMPNVLGDTDNYIMANPMQTPPAIVPEWYLLPFYAILRSIPNKLLGVVAMLSAILALLTLPFVDLGRSRGLQFRPLSKMAFYAFIANFLILMKLGAKHVESPFIEFGQLCTALYFLHFIAIIPLISLIENTLIDLENETKIWSIFSILFWSIFLIFSHFSISTLFTSILKYFKDNITYKNKSFIKWLKLIISISISLIGILFAWLFLVLGIKYCCIITSIILLIIKLFIMNKLTNENYKPLTYKCYLKAIFISLLTRIFIFFIPIPLFENSNIFISLYAQMEKLKLGLILNMNNGNTFSSKKQFLDYFNSDNKLGLVKALNSEWILLSYKLRYYADLFNCKANVILGAVHIVARDGFIEDNRPGAAIAFSNLSAEYDSIKNRKQLLVSSLRTEIQSAILQPHFRWRTSEETRGFLLHTLNAQEPTPKSVVESEVKLTHIR